MRDGNERRDNGAFDHKKLIAPASRETRLARLIGYAPAAAEDFKRDFERAFQRGGG